MQDLDKAALGYRIRRIRLQAGLRQWELARLLGTTQSAVHKYEHGVVPEPRRLVELARIGNTSIEWILTGRHWENGSEDQRRPTPDLLQTACALRELADRDRTLVDESLAILREAVQALTLTPADASPEEAQSLVAALRHHARDVLSVLDSAWRIQQAVLRRVTHETAQRLDSSTLLAEQEGHVGDAKEEGRSRSG